MAKLTYEKETKEEEEDEEEDERRGGEIQLDEYIHVVWT